MEAVCVLNDKVWGDIVFKSQKDNSTKVIINISGLTPGKHGFHIHEYGDLREGCSSLCSHFNPFNQVHGGRDSVKRHVGDLGNIIADKNGKCKMTFIDKRIKLKGRCNIIGRSVVIHEKEDDLGKGKGDKKEESLKTGNAGARIACGVIGISRHTE